MRPRRASHRSKTSPAAEFVALTALVVVVALAAGVAIRELDGTTRGDEVSLMKLGALEAAPSSAVASIAPVPPASPAPLAFPAPPHRIVSATPPESVPPESAPPESAAVEPTVVQATAVAKPVAKSRAASPKPVGPTFDGRPLRKVREVRMEVTAYSPDARSCGASADGITASGYSVWTNGMKMVAADTDLLPFGSVISVPGYDGGRPVPVLDRGGAIDGKRLDVLYPTHERALQWGRQWVTVTVWEYADE